MSSSACPKPPSPAPSRPQQKADLHVRFSYGVPLSGIYLNVYSYMLVFVLAFYSRRKEKKRNFLLNISYSSHFSVSAKSNDSGTLTPHTELVRISECFHIHFLI